MVRLRMLVTAIGAAALMAAAAPVAAQSGDGGAVRVSVFGAGSMREGISGLQFAQDVVAFSARVTLPRQSAYQPWVQVQRFTRPDLVCPDGITCTTEGVTALAGVVAPFTRNDREPGVLHPYFLGGIGWVFAEQEQFAYVLGVGGAYAVTGRLAPSLEVRWEDLPGIRNVMMVSLGLRLDLF